MIEVLDEYAVAMDIEQLKQENQLLRDACEFALRRLQNYYVNIDHDNIVFGKNDSKVLEELLFKLSQI